MNSLAQGNPNDNPVADPAAVITSGNARFTVLTPQMIRMEWAADGKFEDRPSMVFLNRKLPVPKFTRGKQGKWITIKTDTLVLKYLPSKSGFTKDNLTVEFTLNGKPVVWTPGTADNGNLLGTARTLDGVRGDNINLEPGLVSRNGWVLVDDSERPLFDNSDWPWVLPRPAGKRQDWYFLGNGHDYKRALHDFTLVAGKIPMPPRFAFGAWWSRYWAYSDQEMKELVQGFESHEIPLDVLVIDMDWHLTFNVTGPEHPKDQSGHSLGWTGYTWNKTLFPDPDGFLKWVGERGLKKTVNLHPASGVQPHEAMYAEMARAMGQDPAEKKYVPFDIASKKFARNYMDILHHPLQKQGIDFFWIDWQQEDKTTLPGVNPTWWLNYVHFSDMARENQARPLIFHRWGGLGNHRYQIGFSGDTVSVWESLAFQPYFTSTAANAGYAYWSHDIGGHMPGAVSPELYTRWIQFGIFSPILRTHTTKNPNAERRIWAYPVPYAKAMREAYLLRYALIPYIYSESRKTYDTGTAFLRPLYYDYPEADEAYAAKDQYMFGDSMMVAPVTSAMSETSQLAAKSVWLPPGEWIELTSGARLKGPARVDRTFGLDEYPVYVKAGAVIPMQPPMRYAGQKPVDPLIVEVFPGASGETRVYEDAGNDQGYEKNEFSFTPVRQTQSGNSVKVEILPAEGSYPGMPKERAYDIHLRGFFPPKSVTANGKAVEFSRQEEAGTWHYHGNEATTVIKLPKFAVGDRVEVAVELPQVTAAQQQMLDGLPGKVLRLRSAMDILNNTWEKGWSPDILIQGYQTGNRIAIDPSKAVTEVEKLDQSWPQIFAAVRALSRNGVDLKAINLALEHLGAPAETKTAKAGN